MIGGNDVSVGASFGILSGDSVNGTLSQLTFSFTLGAYETVDVHSNIDYKLDHSGQDDYGEDTIELSWTLEQGGTLFLAWELTAIIFGLRAQMVLS